MPSTKKVPTPEKNIEAYLAARVKACGGVHIKLNPAWNIGIPDRLVVLSGGRVIFIELKRPVRGRLSQAQKMWKKRLTALGVENYVAASRAEIDNLLD